MTAPIPVATAGRDRANRNGREEDMASSVLGTSVGPPPVSGFVVGGYTHARTSHIRRKSSTGSNGGNASGVKQRAAFPQFCAVCDKQLPRSGKISKLYCSFDCRDRDSMPSPALSLGSSVFEDTSEMFSPTTSTGSAANAAMFRRYSEPPGSLKLFGDFAWPGPESRDGPAGGPVDNGASGVPRTAITAAASTNDRKQRSRSVYIRSGLPLYGEHFEEDLLLTGGIYRMPVPSEQHPVRRDLEYEFPRPR